MKLNVRFNIRRQGKNTPQKIYLILRFNNEKLVFPTAFSVLPKHWNTKAGEIRNVIAVPDRDLINSHFQELKEAANNIYNETIKKRQPITKELFRTELKKWSGQTIEDKPTFKYWLQKFIDESPNRININTGRKISTRTIQEHRTTYSYLLEFEKLNNERLDFDTINLQTLTDFRDYLTTEKGFAVNNIAKHIDNFRQFLRAANDAKINIDKDVINPKKFKPAKETAFNVYLNETELKVIEDLQLSGIQDRVRDLFLIGCNTGLRISDFNNIQPHNIKPDYIDIYQKKTNAKIQIPINHTIRAIFKKYSGKAPAKVSDQKINENLKAICKAAGLTEKIEKHQTKQGELMVTICEKWQLVTSHTARRSYATNEIKKGRPIHAVMRITGHTKEATFMKYIKLTPSEYTELMKRQTNLTEVI